MADAQPTGPFDKPIAKGSRVCLMTYSEASGRGKLGFVSGYRAKERQAGVWMWEYLVTDTWGTCGFESWYVAEHGDVALISPPRDA